MKILIIEDDDALAALISIHLRPLGAEISHVRTCDEVQEELRRIGANPADIVTLDLNLPGSRANNTMEVLLPQIREKNPDAVIVILTGILPQTERERAIELGADEFLIKTPEMFRGEPSLIRRLRDVVMALVRQPVRYQRNAAILTALADHIAGKIKLHAEIGVQPEQ